MKAPFFIVGASRSGTTMLRLMLNAHSQVAVPDEMNYFHFLDLQEKLSVWDSVLGEDEYSALVRNYLLSRSHLFQEKTVDELEEMILADNERSLRGPFRVLMEYWARYFGKDAWGEKTPRNLFYADVIHAMFPSARFIHVIRDPRAVVQSMNSSDYYSEETVFNALNWQRSVQYGDHLLRTHVPLNQQTQVRYEDLVSAPDATVSTICDFLGLSFEPQMLQFYKTSDRHIHQRIRTPSIKQPVNTKSLTKWKERLSPSAVAVIERTCAAEMSQFGYERQTKRTLLASLRIAHKFAYWKWKIWRHRHQRGYEVGYPFFASVQSIARGFKNGLQRLFRSSPSHL